MFLLTKKLFYGIAGITLQYMQYSHIVLMWSQCGMILVYHHNAKNFFLTNLTLQHRALLDINNSIRLDLCRLGNFFLFFFFVFFSF